MKSRDQVRDETQKGSRLFGYITLAVALPGVLMLTVVAPIMKYQYPILAGVAVVFLVCVGIMAAFPRWPPSHMILAHFDALLDRLFGRTGDADG